MVGVAMPGRAVVVRRSVGSFSGQAAERKTPIAEILG